MKYEADEENNLSRIQYTVKIILLKSNEVVR